MFYFSSTSKQLKGSGNNTQTSITNAIAKVPTNDPQFKTFIETGKNKIIQYYESKCQDILTKSENLVKMQDFEQALGLLMSVPEEVSCYNKVQEKSIIAYKIYQNNKCAKQVQKAKAEIAANNYNNALNLLSQIDPSTSCYKEAETLIKLAEAKVDVEEKKEHDLKMKVYENNIALEKERINAIKDIAAAYLKSKPTTINYSYIVK